MVYQANMSTTQEEAPKSEMKEFTGMLLKRVPQTFAAAFVTSGIYYNIRQIPTGKFHNSLMIATNFGYASLMYCSAHYYLRKKKFLPKEVHNHAVSGLLTGLVFSTITRRPMSQILATTLAFSLLSVTIYKTYEQYLWWKIRRSLRLQGKEDELEETIFQQTYAKLLKLGAYTKENIPALPDWLTQADPETKAVLEKIRRFDEATRQDQLNQSIEERIKQKLEK